MLHCDSTVVSRDRTGEQQRCSCVGAERMQLSNAERLAVGRRGSTGRMGESLLEGERAPIIDGATMNGSICRRQCLEYVCKNFLCSQPILAQTALWQRRVPRFAPQFVAVAAEITGPKDCRLRLMRGIRSTQVQCDSDGDGVLRRGR
jgi:hypothetical protein